MLTLVGYIKATFEKRIPQHLLFWSIVILYFTFGYGKPGYYVETVQRVMLFLPGHIFLTYMFFYYLIPRYLQTQRYILLVIVGLTIYFISLFYGFVVNFYLLDLFDIPSIWIGSPLIGQTTMLGAALSIKFLKQWYKEKQRTQELKQQNIQSELKLLKSQIHPHFLFNTLNNLYSSILDQSPGASDIVLKLSELLRFMVYESADAFIKVSKEITLLQHYLDLEKLRYGDRLEVAYSVNGDFHNKYIAPMLLLPLIENAFKHGVSHQIEQCWISIDIHIVEDWFSFKIINSRDDTEEIHANRFGGVGIENVKKRLKLIYPDKHSFKITNTPDIFVVNLRVKLLSDTTSTNPSYHVKKLTYGDY
jgi:sensor histidine kinase YesM